MNKHLSILLLLALMLPLLTPAAAHAAPQPQAETCETAVIHYRRRGNDYEGWGLHVWGPTAVTGVTWQAPLPPAGQDDYGIYWEVPMSEGAELLNYIVHKGDEKDPGPDQTMKFAEVGCEIWITQGKADQFTTPDDALASMEVVLTAAPEPGGDTAIIHYTRVKGDYDGWGLHIWGPTAVEGVTWGSPLMPAGQDEYGIYWIIDMQPDADHLNYIVHKGDEKDPGPDQTLNFAEKGREIWLIEGSAEQFTSPEAGLEALRAARLGDIQNKAMAHFLSRNYLVWDADLTPQMTVSLYYSPDGGITLTEDGLLGGQTLPLTYVGNVLRPELAQKFPHLQGLSVLKLDDEYTDQLPEILRGQVVIGAVGADGEPQGATALQIAGVLDDLYADAAQDATLGVEFEGDVPTLRVWAPTAKSVTLLLFEDSTSPEGEEIPMTLDSATGIWSVTGEADWKGRFYLYDVEVFIRQEGRFVHNRVTDPYSFSLAANSARSQIVDLSDPDLMPDGWETFAKPPLKSFTDIVIYELHCAISAPLMPACPKRTAAPTWRSPTPTATGCAT